MLIAYCVYSDAMRNSRGSGVVYCHENNIAHRDLKAENILFTDVQAKIVKITDFGILDLGLILGLSLRLLRFKPLHTRRVACSPGVAMRVGC